MDAPLQFRLFGPLQVRRDGAKCAVGGRRERALLAALVLTPDEAVEVERLALLLWPEARPRDVGHALRTHVMRLRRHLGGDLVETLPGAYAIRVDPCTVDAHRFDQLVSSGTARLDQRELAGAEAMLGEALALWHHGAPYIDLAGTELGDAERARLVEERLEAEERLAAVRWSLHRPPLLDIEKLALEAPLRESRRLLLMVALFTVGEQARALRSYASHRTQLRHELGLDPDPRLQAMEHRILAQDPTLSDIDPLSLVLV